MKDMREAGEFWIGLIGLAEKIPCLLPVKKVSPK
jgi:hypothetical protein